VDRPAAYLYAGLTAVYVLFRLGSFTNIGDRVTDTPTYEAVARHAVWDWGFWTGGRGFVIPLAYKLVHGTEPRTIMQLVVSTISWLVLASAVARAVRDRRLRYVAFAAVLVFSLTTEVILWETLLLSESLTFSIHALLLAAWRELVQRPNWRWTATVLALSLLWAFARDTDSYVVLFVGVLVAVTAWRPGYRKLKLVLVAGCVAIFLLDYGSATVGKRWLQPMDDIVAHRVVPVPSLQSYFVAHGLDLHGNWPLSPWMTDRSRNVYAGYLITHPFYTLAAPFHGRQAALYSTARNVESVLDPTIAPYNDNASHRFMPLPRILEHVFFPRGVAVILVLAALVLLLGGVVWRFIGFEPVWLVPLAIFATTYPHLVVVWHESGVEVDRHAFGAALLLRLAVLLLGLFAVDVALGRDRSVAAIRRHVRAESAETR
jgi:hypothetical protein